MDKTAIRNFAIEARKILMKSAIAEAGFYGISKDGVKAPIQKGKDFEVYETLAGTEKRIFGDDIKRRENLANAVKELGFEQVIEETAYTWFNRIIAIRFMEVNNYLPTRVRVLSSETGSSTPDIVTQADTVELNMSASELESVQQAKQDNKYDEAFRLLFIKQCNELNAILPGLFEKTNDYMELLLKIPYTGDGVIRMLIDTIPEDNFNVDTEGQVEIIGWMYQYYNTELKDDTFAKLKKNVKITKERIPAATQLFTPDWIVRYMVENSLGRVWIEHLRAVDSSVDEKSKAEEFGWKYYLPEAEQEENVAAQLVDNRASYKSLTPQDITCIDPCMGSGHILVYMFDVLMDIYRSEGFSEREAVFDILEKNIRGLDIDRRAYQLSYFALMMKARGSNRIFFRGHENLDGERVQAVPQVYAIEESNSVKRDQLKYFGSNMSEIERNSATNEIIGLLDQLKDAKEYGSILDIENYNWDLMKRFISNIDFTGQMDLGMLGIEHTQQKLLWLIGEGQSLAIKYDAVITNPPYMGSRGYSTKLSDYVQRNFPDSKQDMFAVFIEHNMSIVKKSGYVAMITMHSFMFLSAFENMRRKFLNNNIISLVHLGIKAFDEIGNDVVQTASYVVRKQNITQYSTEFCRLVGCKDQLLKQQEFLNKNYLMTSKVADFIRIPGAPIAYWVSKRFIDNFEKYASLEAVITMSALNKTGDNDKYLRYWWEVDYKEIGERWRYYSKGGNFRRYYGNIQDVIDWSTNARNFYKNNKTSNLINEKFWYKEGITYSAVTSRGTGFRYLPSGCLYDMGGPAIFVNDRSKLLFVLSLLNSAVATYYFSVLNPSINLQTKDIKALPFIYERTDEIEELARQNFEIAKNDWNASETSFEFSGMQLSNGRVKDFYEKVKEKSIQNHHVFMENLQRIDDIFSEIYGISRDELPEIEERDIAVSIPTEDAWIKKLISYSVGCMFGRYSLDEEGIMCTSEAIEMEHYSSYSVDPDNIIPISDSDYFEDDILARFVEFISVTFGEEYVEENLDYIANVLGGKGTAKEIIRNYFINDFYKEHCSEYSVSFGGKRPIYWCFDSGKENGFKCLVYMHRYNKDTVGRIRSDYLLRAQSAIENALKNTDYILLNSTSSVDKAQAAKNRDKYIKQLSELKMYYQALSHIALQQITLDLNEGVRANYSKFQNIEVVGEGSKKQIVDLLAKI